jgi:hypothetical protein
MRSFFHLKEEMKTASNILPWQGLHKELILHKKINF